MFRPRLRLAASLSLPLAFFLACLLFGVPAFADAPTAAEAKAFVDQAEQDLLDLWIMTERANWIQSTYIIHDTEILAAEFDRRSTMLAVRLAKEAARFNGLDLDPDTERKLGLLKTAILLPAPSDPALTAELTKITTSLASAYGRGKHCPEGGECRDLGQLGNVLSSSRDEAELRDAWLGWRTVSAPMRDDFARYAELANQGAQELGYDDFGAFWRSKYDMAPDDFAAEVDRLWNQVEPFYKALHCHVRAKLAEHYGTDVVDPEGPIPAHLLGNMWSQSWANIYDLVAPEDGDPGYDITELLHEQNVDEREMVRIGERFFTSLGFEPLPETFWERSQFVQPKDRDVVCHASAWNLDWIDDLRIKMCIQINADDFQTIHHELGHNFYQRAYNHLAPLYRDSANDGFHEAVGDTIALSVTPKYVVDLGWIDEEPAVSADLGLMLRQALDKIAFLPFGLLVDQWRWKVFSGEVTPENYNASWWELREKYQGLKPAEARSEEHFDPGAKYHVASNVSYTRYFLAHILQFQFHRALCDAAGYEGPLNRCSIYDSEAAGKKLNDMLAMGLSRPWPDAMEALTGKRNMDGTAIVDYFAPLTTWLEKQNEGRSCGW